MLPVPLVHVYMKVKYCAIATLAPIGRSGWVNDTRLQGRSDDDEGEAPWAKNRVASIVK
jgi:hypothetical protein